MRGTRHTGFTLLELLLVVAVISLLIALLLPAVNAAREASRRSQCLNTVRQITLAMQTHQAQQQTFPCSRRGQGGWSAHTQLLPYLEQHYLAERLDWDVSYAAMLAAGEPAFAADIPISFRCPSMTGNGAVLNQQGEPIDHPANYVFNNGIWFIWDPQTRAVGAGACVPYRGLAPLEFSDGLSNTVAVAEAVPFQPYEAGAAQPGWLAVPGIPPQLPPGTAHTSQPPTAKLARSSWVQGVVHQTGFTGTYSPGVEVPIRPGSTITHWTNQPEDTSADVRTYAVAPAQSRHAGGIVIVGWMDGHTTATRTPNRRIWQTMCTRAGNDYSTYDE